MTDSETDVDSARLESSLAEYLQVDVTGTEVLADGLNQIISISTAADENAYVLRRPRKLRHTSYIIELEREYGVMKRLDDTTVDAPTPVLFCDDESVLGDPFFVMTHLAGSAIPLGSDPPERFRNAESRRRIADRVIDTLAEIHSVDVEPFEDVCEHLTPREEVVRATDRLDAATRVTGHEISRLRTVGDWLQRNAPSDPETTLVHGDFRPGNIHFAGTDSPEVTGVLDWETAKLGDPRVELGYLLLRWRDEGDPTPSLDELEAKHPNEDVIRHLRDQNEHGLSPFTARPGSPTRRELVDRYEEKSGLSFENERFFRALAPFLLATVWEDLHRHQIAAGAESDWEPHVEYMSMVADSIVSGELPL